MSKITYVPDRGDIIWIDFNPVMGHEQGGKRPALVISPVCYNRKAGTALVCPITSKIKQYPYEVILENQKTIGAVLSDHIKTLDINARKIKYIEKIKEKTMAQVIAKMMTLLG